VRKIFTRMGDGSGVEVSESELKRDLEEGTRDAAERARISPLSQDELAYLFDLYSSRARFVGVDHGNEVIFSYDNGGCKTREDLTQIPLYEVHELQVYEKFLGADILDLGHIDYSIKPVKAIVNFEQQKLEYGLLVTTAPMLYGSQPNLGLYTQPDGPFPNPMELLPQGKIAEARAIQEEMMERAIRDIVYVAGAMYESGADGFNFDSTAAAGDAEFAAVLRAVEILKKKYPNMGIMMGMAGEFILGMHGEVTYDGVRLAGLYPHKQVELAEKAGVTIFGPAINVRPDRSCAWNVARAITFVKACVQASHIPVHANMGMGLCGIPMADCPPVDAVSRASKAMVELTRLDGL